jgi:hypothetical protein
VVYPVFKGGAPLFASLRASHVAALHRTMTALIRALKAFKPQQIFSD